MEGPVCPALRPPSSCASSSSCCSPCGAEPSVSSPGSHPAPQGGHPSPRGFRAVLSDTPGTGRRSGERSRLCILTGRVCACTGGHHPEGRVCARRGGKGTRSSMHTGAEALPSWCNTTNQPRSSLTPPLLPVPACSTPCKALPAGWDPIPGERIQPRRGPGRPGCPRARAGGAGRSHPGPGPAPGSSGGH